MSDIDTEIEDTLEKVRLARAAYQEALGGADAARTKELKTKLDDAEAAVTRLKRMRGSGPPTICFDEDLLPLRGSSTPLDHSHSFRHHLQLETLRQRGSILQPNGDTLVGVTVKDQFMQSGRYEYQATLTISRPSITGEVSAIDL